MAEASFPKVAEQIISFNKMIVELLTKINSSTTTTDSTINIQIYDENGVLRNYSMPSFKSLKADIDRLNNNINSLYNIDSSGAIIQPTTQNKFKKIITVDLNRDPQPISNLGEITTFKSSPNWFFDSLIDPMLSIELDLTNKIEDNVRKCLIRRYILDFEKLTDGTYSSNGQSALNNFNLIYRNNTNIVIDEFENWYKTTPGILNSSNPKYDEQIFDLEPNNLLYDGEFNVLRIQEDRVNRKLWYVLNTLTYKIVDTDTSKQLSIDDELIVNTPKSSTKYKVIEISTAESNPRVRVEKIEGFEAIPVGIGVLKIYSEVLYSKKCRISVGYDERNTLFIKPINTDNNLVAKKWSNGTGYYTNDLKLSSNSSINGTSMSDFYTNYVYDYGVVLQDMVAKKIPNSLGVLPISPTLNVDNFKVVQINKHLTDNPDSNLVKQKHNYQTTIKSELQQISDAIISRNKTLKSKKFNSDSAKKQAELEIYELIKKKDSKTKLLTSITQEIINISKDPNLNVKPKFSVRGFWDIPTATISGNTKSQEIVQFLIQYRYVSKDGKESPIETFNISDSQSKASFSNWVEIKTDARKRVYDSVTGVYSWQIEDVQNADTPNINQLDLSIQNNERIEFRIKSISEVGWPESPLYSDWSDIITIDFPSDLNTILNENEFILQEATKEDLKASLNSELTSKGIDEHLSDSIVINNKQFHHESKSILSGFKDENGNQIDLFEYLKKLENRIISLEEKIKRAKGELEVVVFRNNQEFLVNNNSELTFNIECEDYLDSFSGTNIPTGRVYQNNIYVIKDFVVKFRNKSVETALGLLSNRSYLTQSELYNKNAPQIFWVNNQDELQLYDIDSKTRTQKDNQFVWSVNYDSVSNNLVSKVSENVGNNFVTDDNNSITNILSTPEYNVGFNENSVLKFVGSNNSLLDPSKWIDTNVSIASTTKLLTTIHPVVKNLDSIQELNNDKIKTINSGDTNSIVVPINIYFKINALDTTQTGLNYQYIDLNNSTNTSKHIKKVKFMIENEAENRPFIFTLKFNISRNKVIVRKNNLNNTDDWSSTSKK